jgi:hypothetical protein
MSHWLGEVWIWIQDILVLPLSLFCFEDRVFLSRGVQVAGAAWRAATRIMTGVGDLVQKIRDGRTGQVLCGQTVERSGDAVCGLHRAWGDEERGFLGWASKPRSMVCQGLTSKPLGQFLPVWPQNRWRRFLWFGLKISGDDFSGLASKPVSTISPGLV